MLVREDLMTLEAYAAVRSEFKRTAAQHRRARQRARRPGAPARLRRPRRAQSTTSARRLPEQT